MHPQQLLLAMFRAAIDAASPQRCLPPHLPAVPRGRTIVVGAGKAAASMARAVEEHWPGNLSGLVVTRYAHAVHCDRIEVVEANHPIPDAAGLAVAARILTLVDGLTSDDLVLCLISGGGSSLLALPADTITLADKRNVNQQLLRCGATIDEINCVRKHLSAIKGGRLAVAAQPAQLVSLVISDVPGDDLSVIASGPTVADPTTRNQALQILERYDLNVEPHVIKWLQNEASETPKPGDARLSRVQNVLITTPQRSLEAAAGCALAHGVQPLILGDAIEGAALECAKVHAGIALSCVVHAQPAKPPCVLISGGETTVTVSGGGRGGRNTEFLLALALALRLPENIWALACDTDGIDGTEDNAGAQISPDTLTRAAALGLNPSSLLEDNDAYTLFESLQDLVVTGPTRTNVNDFRAILIERGAI